MKGGDDVSEKLQLVVRGDRGTTYGERWESIGNVLLNQCLPLTYEKRHWGSVGGVLGLRVPMVAHCGLTCLSSNPLREEIRLPGMRKSRTGILPKIGL